MTTTHFATIKDKVLCTNLDRVFDHILTLIPLSESTSYEEIVKSSFCKTIIIYTASIIEALLLYILKQNKTEQECARVKAEFKILLEIYKIDDTKRIVLGEDIEGKEKLKFNKINLGQINDLCLDHGIIDKNMYKNIDKVRYLRNSQHLGSLSGIDRSYTKEDLKFVFDVAKQVKATASSL